MHVLHLLIFHTSQSAHTNTGTDIHMLHAIQIRHIESLKSFSYCCPNILQLFQDEFT